MASLASKLAKAAKAESYSVDEVAVLLDVPEWCVERWCRGSLIPGAKWKRGAWVIPDRGLSFFLGRTVEPLYSVDQMAGILAVEVETVRDYLAAGRMATVKLGTAKSAPVRVAESELRRWVNAGRAESRRATR